MPSIIPIIEGRGEQEAVPNLVSRILHQQEHWDWYVGAPHRANNLGALRKNLESFLRNAAKQQDCGGMLVLMDLDDGCPAQEATTLSEQARQFGLSQPVSIVFPHREFEAWFLASLPTVAGRCDLPHGLIYPGEVEQIRGVKEWLTNQMPSGKRYNPTLHQAELTRHLDFQLALERSRSFQRLWHAVDQIVEAAGTNERGVVTP